MQRCFSEADVLRVHRIEEKLQDLRPLIVSVVIFRQTRRQFIIKHVQSEEYRIYWLTKRKPTYEIARELGGDVTDLLADVGGCFRLDSSEQLGLDSGLNVQGHAGIDLLERCWQQPPQQHGRHLLDLSTRRVLMTLKQHFNSWVTQLTGSHHDITMHTVQTPKRQIEKEHKNFSKYTVPLLFHMSINIWGQETQLWHQAKQTSLVK